MKNLSSYTLFLSVLLLVNSCAMTGKLSEDHEDIKLKSVTYEVPVSVSKQKAWDVLASYANVGDYHAGVKSSSAINNSENDAVMGCDRICYLQDGKREIMVKEKIIDIKDGEYYTYNVYEWDNFPLKKMQNTFGVKTNTEGKTIIYQIINYRLKPGMMTGLMKGKIKTQARDALLAYKHYMETGIENGDWDTIQNLYADL